MLFKYKSHIRVLRIHLWTNHQRATTLFVLPVQSTFFWSLVQAFSPFDSIFWRVARFCFLTSNSEYSWNANARSAARDGDDVSKRAKGTIQSPLEKELHAETKRSVVLLPVRVARPSGVRCVDVPSQGARSRREEPRRALPTVFDWRRVECTWTIREHA